MTRIRPDYRGILRLAAKQLSQEKIACSVGSSKKTVNRILRLAKERGLSWPLPDEQTNDVLAKVFSKPPKVTQTDGRDTYILQSKDPRYEAQSFEERFAALVDAESSACRTTSQILPWLVKRIPTARY